MILLTLVIGLCSYILTSYIYKTWKERRYGCVPGPFPLPIIGNLYLVGDYIPLSKKYGEVFAIHFGSQRHLVVSGAKSIKEVIVEKGTHFAGRPLDNIKLDIASSGYKDILSADYGSRFRYMRKVFARGLNLHGFNKKSVEDTIAKHADATIAHLTRN